MDYFSTKLEVIDSGLVGAYAIARRKAHFEGDRSELDALLDNYGLYKCSVAANVSFGTYKKKARCKEKIGDVVLGGDCLFLTFTFRDDVLARTKPETRRRYVSRYLKKHCDSYVANIDFGAKNGREHYHALADCGYVDPHEWKYGNLDIERVRARKGDLERVIKYVAKLTLHALKETARRPAKRLLYSRSSSTARV